MMTERHVSTTALLVLLSVVLAAFSPLIAEDPSHPLCRLLLREEQAERDDLELEVGLAGAELTAAEEIFKLLDQLWKDDAVERILFLAGKHDRDAAKLEQEHRALLVERQDALIDQYRLLCDAPSGEIAEERRAAVERTYQRYLGLECDRLAKEVAIARVDLAYRQEVLVSVRDLRENSVATRQDVVLAERNVELARKRNEHGSRRVENCRGEIADKPSH